MMKEITDEKMLKDFLQEEGRAILFKHSTRCPVSARAYQEMEAFAEEYPEVPIGLVKVIESRPLSFMIVDMLGVIHQSPQAIIVEKGQVVMHASHFDVKKDKLAPYFA